MLINDSEYRQMHEVERSLWWYRILHEKVLTAIQQSFDNKAITILDAGCGTGGLIQFLNEKGYQNIKGFDFAKEGVKLCLERNLNVIQADILNLENIFNNKFDLIICNDVLCQFDDSQIKTIVPNLLSKLNPKGVLISNNQAFEIFSGTHDLAVGAKKRFKIEYFSSIIPTFETKITELNYNYWSLFLSPIILSIRLLQKIKLYFGLVDLKALKSDVKLPPIMLNNLFYKIVKLEEKLIKKAFIGSSLFMIIKK
jgi:SAM-dependent methyltransferase